MKQLTIEVAKENYKISLWGRIKMSVWNFVLPPHIKLSYKELNETE